MGNQALAAIVHEIGPAFSARSAEADRSGAFVADNYRALKQRRLFSAGVPRELGGGGASYAELCEMLRSLAQYCPSTALALAMHTHCVAAVVWRHLHGQPAAAALLSGVAEHELVLVSTGANDWLTSSGTAVRVDGGWRVTGKKRFASGSPAGNLIITSAPAEVDHEALVLHFAVRADAPGVRVGDDWDALGMRATGSHTLSLDEVFVPDAAVSIKRPRGTWHPAFDVIAPVALPIILSVYVGLAEHAASLAKASAAGRTSDAHLPYQLGEMENALLTAQLALDDTIRGVRNYDFSPELDRTNRTLMCKTVAARVVRRCLELAVEASGGSAFFRKNPLEQLWRDVQAVQFHPLPEKQQLSFTGRIAMGLAPVAE